MAANRNLYNHVAISVRQHVDVYIKLEDKLQLAAVVSLVADLCIDFKQDNIHFDRQRFITACGLTDYLK